MLRARRPSRKVVSSWPTYTGCIKCRALSLGDARLKARPSVVLASMSRDRDISSATCATSRKKKGVNTGKDVSGTDIADV